MSAIAKLIAGIGLNTDEFKKGIGEVSSSTSGLQKNFGDLKNVIVGAFSIYAVSNFVKGLASVAKEISAAAAESGSTTTGFQALREAMEDAGLSGDKVAGALKKIEIALIDAANGNTKTAAAFASLGLSLDDIAGKSTDEVFGLMAEAVANTGDKTTAYGAIVDILGSKLATSLLPALEAVGEEGFANLNKRMIESGQIMDEVWIARAIDAQNTWDDATTLLQVRFMQTLNVIASAITGTIEGIRSLISGDSWAEGFGRGFDAYVNTHAEAVDQILERQKAANKNLKAGFDGVADAAKDAADRAAVAAEEAAGRAIDASLAVTNAQWGALETAEGKYQKAVEAARLKSMSAEDRLSEAVDRRSALIKYLQTLEDNRQKYTLEWYNTSTEILRLTGEIEQGERALLKTQTDGGKKTDEIRQRDITLTQDQAAAVGELQKIFSKMTDTEISNFIAVIKKLHDGIQGLDFSKLAGLSALKNFKIPNASIDNANQFGRALKAMSDAMGNLTVPNLAGLEVLKGFQIPNESVLNARQFGRAIAEMIDALNATPLDLKPLQTVADLFSALKGGAIQIQIAVPTRDQLTLGVDESFKADLATVAANTTTLAALKGVIFQ